MNPPNNWADEGPTDPIEAIKQKYQYGYYNERVRSDIFLLMERIQWYKSVSKDMCATCKSYMETCE